MPETTSSKDKMLTPKQEKFVKNVINGMSQRQAFINAYPESKKWKAASIDSKASKTLKLDKVWHRYEELRKKAEDEAVMSAAERRKWLSDVITKGMMNTDGEGLPVKGDLRLKAMDILNKMSGEYVTKLETTEEGFNINISIGYEKDD